MDQAETPRGKRHGMRQFLLEILVVTVGLFIALGLNDIVDWQSHRSLVRTAEASLHDEVLGNIKTIAVIRGQIRTEQKQLDDDLATLAKLRAQANTPAPQPHMKLDFQFRILGFADTAWKTAQTTGAPGYMSYQDVATYSDIYDTQDTVYQAQQQAVDSMLKAAAVVITKPTGAKLTTEEIDETTHRIGEARMRLIYLGDLVDSLEQTYRQYQSTHS